MPALFTSTSMAPCSAVALPKITASLTDTDGSETLSVLISGVPSGATLSSGTRNADGTWTPPKLVIANADKNLGLTVMDYDWFHRECLRQLYNRDFYRELPERLARARVRAAFQHLTRLVHAGRLVHDLAQVVPAPRRLCRAQRFLLSRPPTHAEHRVPSFRIIPKVHKTPVAGRPITPAHRYLFSPANELITQVLHPIVSLIPEILRDSNQLLFELEDAATLNIYPGDEIYLVTGDVESLYTNIPRAECLPMLQ